MRKPEKQNNPPSEVSSVIGKMRRSIRWQAGLALVTIVLTVILIFSMTAAWYTNVVQSGGLLIHTESWGFDGEIKVTNTAVQAAPGDEGVISLEVNNTNDSQASVRVGMSKARMELPMQQRLYFYIDTPGIRNGETMERIYLNTKETYTYTLFPGESLVLDQERHTDARLKWHWVYDVLGYYVLGTWSAERNTLSAVDYLRPIEYDYDQATTTFRDSGDSTTLELQTVDGVTTVEEFLVKLSKTDGYPGQIDPNKKLGAGYYPVDVDESGYGVYAYLCTYADIELATVYDTTLAQEEKNAQASGAPGKSYEAVLQLCAQKEEETVVRVASLSALQELMTLQSRATVQLTGDISVSDENPLVLPEGSWLTLDLNGHSLVSTGEKKAIEALPGSTLTVVNGGITGSGGYGIYAIGSRVTCHQVELSGFRYGVCIGDSDGGNKTDSMVRLVNCTMDAQGYGVFLSGNGTASEQKTQLVVDGCTMTSYGMVICSNGSTAGSGRWGTDIQILNSTLISDTEAVSTAIYHPQKDSTMTIYNSTLSGYTGMAIKGGAVRVLGSNITGNGAKQAPGDYASGFADTGDGIYIEANYGYEISLEIGSGQNADGENTPAHSSVITSTYGESLQVFQPEAENVTVQIFSGEFDQAQKAAYLAPGATQAEKDGKYVITSQQAE